LGKVCSAVLVRQGDFQKRFEGDEAIQIRKGVSAHVPEAIQRKLGVA